MSERDWPGELESYLRDRLVELCGTFGQPVPFSGLRINPALGLEESKYFLLGLETGLFQIDAEGCVQSELLPSGSEESPGTIWRLFRHNPPPPRLVREGVCQLSTVSLLILKRGWLKSHLVITSSVEADFSPVDQVDILVKSTDGKLLICVGVKRSVAELEKLITDLRTCCNRGAHAQGDCGFPQNHPKYEFCARAKPAYFWGVAPEAAICLRMKYEGDAIEIEQLPSLPPRSMIE